MEEYSYTSTHPLGHTGPVTGSLYLYLLLKTECVRGILELNIPYFSHFSHGKTSSIRRIPMPYARIPLQIKYHSLDLPICAQFIESLNKYPPFRGAIVNKTCSSSLAGRRHKTSAGRELLSLKWWEQVLRLYRTFYQVTSLVFSEVPRTCTNHYWRSSMLFAISRPEDCVSRP